MNVYRIRLLSSVGGNSTYDRFWSAETMEDAIDQTFRQWQKDNDEPDDAGEFFENEVLRACEFIGELENG